ncbi:MAG TPA: serine/threonine-protein kinase [Polyangiaceae bacterium]|jgi:serine/threonine-protein kinase
MDLPARIGRYDVELLLGEGGMGRVLLARDTVLGRGVALKILRDDLGLTPELRAQLVERMRQEARAAATLSHPAMVTLHDMGEDERVGLYLVFERIIGPTLRERLHENGALPPVEVAAIARALGSALTHAHAAGVVHRDVKPENVMLSKVGPKLTDFGIARLPDSTLTRATTVLGTPAYSAPEALGSGTFGPASDQFSLAATLYEALTGKRAFPGEDTLAVATRVATGKHAAPTSVLPALRGFAHLDVIFDRSLAKDDAKRFGSCEAFGNALAAELEGANASHPMTPIPRWSIATRKTRKLQNTAILAGLLVIAALVVVGRFRPDEADGVSLRAVASSFATSAAGATVPRPAGGAATHRAQAHIAGAVVSGAASTAGSAATSAPGSATPSGSEHPVLDSAPADAGREHTAGFDTRGAASDAGAGDAPQR